MLLLFGGSPQNNEIHFNTRHLQLHARTPTVNSVNMLQAIRHRHHHHHPRVHMFEHCNRTSIH